MRPMTDIWPTAKLRLTDFLMKNQEKQTDVAAQKCSEVAPAFDWFDNPPFATASER